MYIVTITSTRPTPPLFDRWPTGDPVTAYAVVIACDCGRVTRLPAGPIGLFRCRRPFGGEDGPVGCGAELDTNVPTDRWHAPTQPAPPRFAPAVRQNRLLASVAHLVARMTRRTPRATVAGA